MNTALIQKTYNLPHRRTVWENERGQKGRQPRLTSDQIENPSEVRMAKENVYRDSIPSDKPEQLENWQHVSQPVARLKERVIAAMNAGNYEVAESYHVKLIQAEAKERGQE